MSTINALIGTSLESFDEIVSKVNSKTAVTSQKTGSFDNLLQSAIDMIETTNNYQIEAQEAELNFAMGYDTNTHTLSAAQSKATQSLQYTVAVRDKVLEAYNQIMNMTV